MCFCNYAYLFNHRKTRGNILGELEKPEGVMKENGHNSIAEQPVIGVTMGDAAGIGPEVVGAARGTERSRRGPLGGPPLGSKRQASKLPRVCRPLSDQLAQIRAGTVMSSSLGLSCIIFWLATGSMAAAQAFAA